MMIHVTLAEDGEVVEDLMMPSPPAEGDLVVVKRDAEEFVYRVLSEPAAWISGDPWLLQLQVERENQRELRPSDLGLSHWPC